MKFKTIVPIFPIVKIAGFILLASSGASASSSLELNSPAFIDGGILPVQFSCEGAGISPPLNWQGVPDGTQSLLLIMDHLPKARLTTKNDTAEKRDNQQNKRPKPEASPKQGLRWYWTMYNIPLSVSAIASGQSVGTLGGNAVNDNNEYAPPCSKGPGIKNYTFHLYALSKQLQLTESENVSELLLRKNMRGLVLDSVSLNVNFERSCQSPPKQEQQQAKIQNDHQQSEVKLPLCNSVLRKGPSATTSVKI